MAKTDEYNKAGDKMREARKAHLKARMAHARSHVKKPGPRSKEEKDEVLAAINAVERRKREIAERNL